MQKIPGLLHFFEIFCNTPGVTTVVKINLLPKNVKFREKNNS